MKMMFQLAQKPLVPFLVLAACLCLICAGCGSKTPNPPVAGGSAASQIVNNPNATPAMKAQAVAQQQMASKMQQTMQQEARQQQALMNKTGNK